MGRILIQYYTYISKEKGFDGKIKLAQATKVPSPRAALEKDTEQNIALFKAAVAKITGKPAPEFK